MSDRRKTKWGCLGAKEKKEIDFRARVIRQADYPVCITAYHDTLPGIGREAVMWFDVTFRESAAWYWIPNTSPHFDVFKSVALSISAMTRCASCGIESRLTSERLHQIFTELCDDVTDEFFWENGGWALRGARCPAVLRHSPQAVTRFRKFERRIVVARAKQVCPNCLKDVSRAWSEYKAAKERFEIALGAVSRALELVRFANTNRAKAIQAARRPLTRAESNLFKMMNTAAEIQKTYETEHSNHITTH